MLRAVLGPKHLRYAIPNHRQVTVNERERFWRLMHFQPVDRIPLWADWLGPFNRWHGEGLPAAVERPRQRHRLFRLRGHVLRLLGRAARAGQDRPLSRLSRRRRWRRPAPTASIAPARAWSSGSSRTSPARSNRPSGSSTPSKPRRLGARCATSSSTPTTPAAIPPPQEWAALKRPGAPRDHVHQHRRRQLLRLSARLDRAWRTSA